MNFFQKLEELQNLKKLGLKTQQNAQVNSKDEQIGKDMVNKANKEISELYKTRKKNG